MLQMKNQQDGEEIHQNLLGKGHLVDVQYLIIVMWKWTSQLSQI